MERIRYRPFTGDTATHLKLKQNALVLVLCQLRWPTLRNLRDAVALDGAVRQLDEVFRDYPLVREGQELSFNITTGGVEPSGGDTVHEWLSPDETWIATLSTRSFSLACNRGYVGFDEFGERLRPILEGVLGLLQPPRLDRLGVRYVNRFSGDETLSRLQDLFLGYRQPVSAIDDSVALLGSTQQCLYRLGDIGLQVRSGHVPPHQTVDPAIAPVDEVTWVLDLDSFREGPQSADVEVAMGAIGKLADINYDYFRCAITPEFVRLHGGE